MKSILEEAKQLQLNLVEYRRYLHMHAETQFDLPMTVKYVSQKLIEMGYKPEFIGNSGIVVLVGKKDSGKTLLLRADMDALPIVEQTDLPFKSETKNMHACGHDLHAAMLLGAARLLKNHENELEGCVKLLFQPNEEALKGAKNMIDAGLLNSPKVDAAVMLHVQTGLPLPVPTGLILTLNPGPVLASCDWFTINIQGKGGHSGNPQNAVDPINVACHINIALQTIITREALALDPAILTIGEIHGGNTNNIIPDTAFLKGTIRAFGKENRSLIKKRLVEISQGIAATFNASATVEYTTECPCLYIDGALESKVERYSAALLGSERVINLGTIADGAFSRNTGSEDFAFVSELVPTAAVYVVAGSRAEGYQFGNHHPKATFDENTLFIGTAVYTNTAIQWLKDN